MIIKVTESNDFLFSEALRKRGITQHIKVGVFHDQKIKVKDSVWAVVKILDERTKGVIEYQSDQNSPDVAIFIREDFLNALSNINPQMASLAVEKCIEGVSVNLESGKVSVNKPDVTEHYGILEKYGLETAIEVYAAAVAQAMAKLQKDAEDNTTDEA